MVASLEYLCRNVYIQKSISKNCASGIKRYVIVGEESNVTQYLKIIDTKFPNISYVRLGEGSAYIMTDQQKQLVKVSNIYQALSNELMEN